MVNHIGVNFKQISLLRTYKDYHFQVGGPSNSKEGLQRLQLRQLLWLQEGVHHDLDASQD